jgi:hypothetical protein
MRITLPLTDEINLIEATICPKKGKFFPIWEMYFLVRGKKNTTPCRKKDRTIPGAED